MEENSRGEYKKKEKEINEHLTKFINRYKDIFDSYVTTLKEKTKIYTVDLSSAFNKKYIGDDYSYNKDDFKTKGTLLVKIENNEITEHYEVKDDIINKLKDLSAKRLTSTFPPKITRLL